MRIVCIICLLLDSNLPSELGFMFIKYGIYQDSMIQGAFQENRQPLITIKIIDLFKYLKIHCEQFERDQHLVPYEHFLCTKLKLHVVSGTNSFKSLYIQLYI